MKRFEKEHPTTVGTGLMRFCLEHSSSTAVIIVTTTSAVIPEISVGPWCGEDDLETSLVFMKIRPVSFRVLL